MAKKPKLKNTHLEDLLAFQIRALKLPEPKREYLFHPTRKWRFDFCWVDYKVAVECEGGIWSGGAHTRGKHFISDATKYNEAAIMGWRILRFAVNMINDGSAIIQLERALKSSPHWKGK